MQAFEGSTLVRATTIHAATIVELSGRHYLLEDSRTLWHRNGDPDFNIVLRDWAAQHQPSHRPAVSDRPFPSCGVAGGSERRANFPGSDR